MRWPVVGRLREVRRTTVAAEQPGRIIEVAVETGDSVEGSQTVIARIDDIWSRLAMELARARLQESKAAVEEAAATLDQARRDRVYLEELLEASSAKPKEVDDARTFEKAEAARLERAKADALAAEAEVKRIAEELRRATVLAPFDGVVVKKMTEVGQWVDQGDSIAEIISRGSIDAVIDVPESLINSIQPGQTVEVWIDPLRQGFPGKVAAITPLGESAARSYPVKVRLDDHEGTLKAGMSVTARVPTTEKAPTFTVPRDALDYRAGGTAVWVEDDGHAARIAIEVLFGADDRYAVRADRSAPTPLVAGQRVVTEGVERLMPGQPIAPVGGGS